MSARHSLIVVGVQAGIVLAAVIAVTILGVEGTLDGQSVVAILGAAIGFAGGAGASVSAVGQAVNGKATVSDATLRQAMSSHALEEPPEH